MFFHISLNFNNFQYISLIFDDFKQFAIIFNILSQTKIFNNFQWFARFSPFCDKRPRRFSESFRRDSERFGGAFLTNVSGEINILTLRIGGFRRVFGGIRRASRSPRRADFAPKSMIWSDLHVFIKKTLILIKLWIFCEDKQFSMIFNDSQWISMIFHYFHRFC